MQILNLSQTTIFALFLAGSLLASQVSDYDLLGDAILTEDQTGLKELLLAGPDISHEEGLELARAAFDHTIPKNLILGLLSKRCRAVLVPKQTVPLAMKRREEQECIEEVLLDIAAKGDLKLFNALHWLWQPAPMPKELGAECFDAITGSRYNYPKKCRKVAEYVVSTAFVYRLIEAAVVNGHNEFANLIYTRMHDRIPEEHQRGLASYVMKL